MSRYHLNLTAHQALGYTLQWWDNRSTLDKTRKYKVRLERGELGNYCVCIDAPWNSTFVIHIDTQAERMSIFSPEQYHYKQFTLGLYKRQDLRALFLWAQRIMEHSTTI